MTSKANVLALSLYRQVLRSAREYNDWERVFLIQRPYLRKYLPLSFFLGKKDVSKVIRQEFENNANLTGPAREAAIDSAFQVLRDFSKLNSLTDDEVAEGGESADDAAPRISVSDLQELIEHRIEEEGEGEESYTDSESSTEEDVWTESQDANEHMEAGMKEDIQAFDWLDAHDRMFLEIPQVYEGDLMPRWRGCDLATTCKRVRAAIEEPEQHDVTVADLVDMLEWGFRACKSSPEGNEEVAHLTLMVYLAYIEAETSVPAPLSLMTIRVCAQAGDLPGALAVLRSTSWGATPPILPKSTSNKRRSLLHLKFERLAIPHTFPERGGLDKEEREEDNDEIRVQIDGEEWSMPRQRYPPFPFSDCDNMSRPYAMIESEGKKASAEAKPTDKTKAKAKKSRVFMDAEEFERQRQAKRPPDVIDVTGSSSAPVSLALSPSKAMPQVHPPNIQAGAQCQPRPSTSSGLSSHPVPSSSASSVSSASAATVAESTPSPLVMIQLASDFFGAEQFTDMDRNFDVRSHLRSDSFTHEQVIDIPAPYLFGLTRECNSSSSRDSSEHNELEESFMWQMESAIRVLERRAPLVSSPTPQPFANVMKSRLLAERLCAPESALPPALVPDREQSSVVPAPSSLNPMESSTRHVYDSLQYQIGPILVREINIENIPEDLEGFLAARVGPSDQTTNNDLLPASTCVGSSGQVTSDASAPISLPLASSLGSETPLSSSTSNFIHTMHEKTTGFIESVIASVTSSRSDSSSAPSPSAPAASPTSPKSSKFRYSSSTSASSSSSPFSSSSSSSSSSSLSTASPTSASGPSSRSAASPLAATDSLPAPLAELLASSDVPLHLRHSTLRLLDGDRSRQVGQRALVSSVLPLALDAEILDYTILTASRNSRRRLREIGFELYDLMRERGVKPSKNSFSALLRICWANFDGARALKVLNIMRAEGFVPEQEHFNRVIATFSTGQHEDFQQSLSVMSLMESDKVQPNLRTFSLLYTQALFLGKPEAILQVLDLASKAGFDDDTVEADAQISADDLPNDSSNDSVSVSERGR